ncbi:MAG: efflux RND transporter periplasmic adaptor subunit [Acidobacteriota bacterium]
MKNILIGFLLGSILIGGIWWTTQRPIEQGVSQTGPPTAVRYHCPMHPNFVSDKPGDCPICGMSLVPIEPVSQEPQPPADHSSHSDDTPGAVVPEGYIPITIPPEKQQLMGIASAPVERIALQHGIKTVGRVTYDETRLHRIHTKFEGYVERIHVNFTGQYVRKGQPLFTIYSPELFATQKEYLLALQESPTSDDAAGTRPLTGIDLLEAARQRLTLWDFGPDEIERLKRTRQPIRAVPFYSPVSGFVSSKTVQQGTRVTPADDLYEILDLSTVWVMADIYEVDFPFVRNGQRADVSLPYQPGKTFWGRLTYVYPMLEEQTRTLKVRIELANPKGELKPDMYADVQILGDLGQGLAIPDSAVLTTGERSIVFVAKEEGVFEPREVVTGVMTGGRFEIKKGLSEGERVAVQANFLLDSESKLRAALSGAAGGHIH